MAATVTAHDQGEGCAPGGETSVMLVMREAPYASLRARERLDLTLMALAFDLKVSVAFVGVGVLQLLPRPDEPDLHDFGAAFASLPLYGVEALYADAGAMRRYRLQADDLRVPVTQVEPAALAELLGSQDLLL